MPTSVRASRWWDRRAGIPRKARATESTSTVTTTAFAPSGRALTGARLPVRRGCGKGSFAPDGPTRALQRLELLGDLRDRRLGVPEEHRGLVVVEQRVVDAGEAAGHRALEDDDRRALVDVEDRHPVDRAV